LVAWVSGNVVTYRSGCPGFDSLFSVGFFSSGELSYGINGLGIYIFAQGPLSSEETPALCRSQVREALQLCVIKYVVPRNVHNSYIAITGKWEVEEREGGRENLENV
jgi:hypothetical protein